jgi:hypothetical protein
MVHKANLFFFFKTRTKICFHIFRTNFFSTFKIETWLWSFIDLVQIQDLFGAQMGSKNSKICVFFPSI